MLHGSCHCNAVQWVYEATPDGATACNCTVCRRYGVLWIYGLEGHGVSVRGATHVYRPGKQLEIHFCNTCGCVSHWRAQQLNQNGQRRIAVNIRLCEPQTVANLPIDHFDGFDTYSDQPRDGKCVADYWY